jgi:uncharacterized delta-60 repeat protein
VLDPSFGSGGTITTDLGGAFQEWGTVGAVALQPDGKVVVAGSLPGDSLASRRILVVRYGPDGSLDATFGTGGVVITAVPGGRAHAAAVVVGRNGAITVAGNLNTAESDTDYPAEILLVRYDRRGRLARSFGQDGIVTTDLGSVSNVANALVELRDGRLLVAGSTGDTFAGLGDFALVRYRPDGSLDPRFGGDGSVTTDFDGGNDVADALLVQPDGRFVAAGYTQVISSVPSQPYRQALARYRRDGSLDRTFGDAGRVTTSVTGSFDLVAALAPQSPSTIVAAGTSAATGRGPSFSLARYHTTPRTR